MLRTLLALVTMSCISFAHAQVNTTVIAYQGGSLPVESTLVRSADYLVQKVSFTSSAATAVEKTKALSGFVNRLSFAAKNQTDIDFRHALVSANPSLTSSSANDTSAGNNNEEYSYYVLALLNNATDNATAMASIKTFIDTANAPSGVEVTLGDVRFAVSSPEQYRSQILNEIKKSIQQTTLVLGSNYSANISGLEGPVLVKQLNARDVVLFIDYDIEYTSQR